MATKTNISYAERMNQVQILLDGLKANAESIAKRGIDEEFIKTLEKHRLQCIELNSEQEKLKADLKLKTRALEEELAQMHKKFALAKKLVKIEFNQAQWIEFGIQDKR